MNKTFNVTLLIALQTIMKETELEVTSCWFFIFPNRVVILVGIWWCWR